MESLAPWKAVIKAFPPDVHTITIFGELFGGGYPHPDVRPVKPAPGLVQRSVYYCPARRFAAFDIRVNGDRYLPFEEAAAIFDAHGIPRVVVVSAGTYDEVLAWAQAHCADVVNPAWYQLDELPLIEENRGEGWVIRPSVDMVNTFGERLIFKVKTPGFS